MHRDKSKPPKTTLIVNHLFTCLEEFSEKYRKEQARKNVDIARRDAMKRINFYAEKLRPLQGQLKIEERLLRSTKDPRELEGRKECITEYKGKLLLAYDEKIKVIQTELEEEERRFLTTNGEEDLRLL